MDANGDVSTGEYDSEEIWAYEVGYKSMWRNNSVRFNAAAFYYDYTDLHVFSLNSSDIGADFVVENADSATLYGLEPPQLPTARED